MNARFLAVVALIVGWCSLAEASLTWRAGEGWSNEEEGSDVKAVNSRAQLELARKLEAAEEWEKSRQAYLGLVRKWPFSFNSGEAQFKIGWCYEKIADFERSFKSYQTCVEKYPASNFFEKAIERQYNIANLYLAGEPRKLWKIPVMPSMDKTIEMYEQIIKNAPYGRYAAESQFKIGQAHERKKEWAEAVKAYQRILDRYPGNDIVDDAQYQIGYAWHKASTSSDYDQGAAQKAIDGFQEFLTRFPNSEKAAQAEENIKELEGRSTGGSFNIAQFYESQKKIDAAIIYYKDVIQKEPDTERAEIARRKITQLTPLSEASVPAPKNISDLKSSSKAPAAPAPAKSAADSFSLEPAGPPTPPPGMALAPAPTSQTAQSGVSSEDMIGPQLPPGILPPAPKPVSPPLAATPPPIHMPTLKSSDRMIGPRPIPAKPTMEDLTPPTLDPLPSSLPSRQPASELPNMETGNDSLIGPKPPEP